MNDYLAAYGNYYEKRNAIIEQGESRKVGKTNGNRSLLTKKQKGTI